jgi:ParB/RepB/Spo0J family partition protein
MTPPDDKPLYQLTALELIDDPQLPARETMDEKRMDDLVASVRSEGLLQPIGLKRNGARYEVVYGHRRTIACRRAELTMVPTIVYPEGYKRSNAAKLHENIYREDLNPGEAAVWFAELLEAMPTPDTDELAQQLNVTRSYLEDRLLLLRGDEFVLEALKHGKIQLTVAQELNRVKEDAVRRDFLGHAIAQGASARVVKNWRTVHEAMRDMNPQQVVDYQPAAEQPAGAKPNPMACLLCSSDHEPHNMLYVQIHRHCLQFFEKHLGLRVVGFFADPPPSNGDPNAR